MNVSPIQNRITGIDALRGFALFGILVVNIFVFHAPYAHYGPFYFAFIGAELAAMQLMFVLFAGKFMFIFAFLFGCGCWMQYEKYNDHLAFRKFWMRRMSWLALFGILHILLLSYGDILLPYAILGMTLPFVLRLKNLTLIFWFLIIYLIPVYEFVFRYQFEYSSISTQPVYELAEEIRIGGEGSFWELFQLRMQQYFHFYNEKMIMYIPKEWSLFIIGILAARKKWATDLPVKKTVLFCLFALVIVIASMLGRQVLFSVFDFNNSILQGFILGLLVQFAEFVHGLLYILGFWLLWRISLFQTLFSTLQFTGRMSLTIYIMQSVICGFIFSGYGMGWYGSKTPIQLLWMAGMIYTAQMIFAVVWLRYYRFGPLEWLWRRLSYGK